MANDLIETNEDNRRPPTLTIDWDLYASLLEESDLTDEQKYEFIETLWSIAVGFVDFAFRIHPVQQACEQNSEKALIVTDKLIESLENSHKKTNHHPAGETNPHRGESEES